MKKYYSQISSILIVTLLSILIFKLNEDLNLITKISIIFLIACTTFVIFEYIINLKKKDYFPLFALSNFYILVSYLAVNFFDRYEIFRPFDKWKDNYPYSVQILLLSYIFFLLGYLIIKYFLKNFKRKEISYLNANINEIYFIALFIQVNTFIFFYIINIQLYFSFFAQIKYPLLVFGSGALILFLSLQNNLKNIIKDIFIPILAISAPIILEIVSGSYSYPFMLIFLLFVFYSFLRKKIIFVPIIILIISFLLIHVGKYQYRYNLETIDKTKNLSKISLFFKTYKKLFTETKTFNKLRLCKSYKDFPEQTPEDVNCFLLRDYRLEKRIFHSMKSLMIVTKKSPEEIPYWSGQSYKILATKLIPRIFWKEKPSDNLGNEFGHRYNVLTKENTKLRTKHDYDTSWNMPTINEFYVNFGVKGSIIGMLIIGFLYAFLEKCFLIRSNYNLEKIISFFIFVPLFFLESHLSLLFGAVIQSYIFLIFVVFVVLYIKRKFLN